MMFGRALHTAAAPFEERDRFAEPAAVGKGTREHDPALGDERR